MKEINKLGRVSEINRRRFSGAFDHLNVFPSESLEKSKLSKQKEAKRGASTARGGNRIELNRSESLNKRAQTALVADSYRNLSIHEK